MRGKPINESAVRQVVERYGFDWHYREETESTNADVLRYHAEHRRDVVAFGEAQTAGRGRRGRQWLSPYARNIYCTIGISKRMHAGQQGLLSIITGLALCRILRQDTAVPICLKWPNDVLHDGRKLGGILIESRPLDEHDHFFAIGFGLNVYMDHDELAEISQPATSLEQVATSQLDRSEVLMKSIESVIESIRMFEPEVIPDLIAEFARFDAFHDRPVEVISGDERITGINRGITEGGQLQLETERGIEIHSAAEISLGIVSE